MDALAAKIKEKMGSEYAGLHSVVLAYSGGLDSQAMGSIFAEMGVKVYPIIFEVGAQGSDTAAIAKQAKTRFGSSQLIDISTSIIRAAERGVKTNCTRSGHLNAGALSRPFMAQALAGAARGLKCSAVAHGSSGLGNDHLRMELSLRALAPELRSLAPVRDWDLRRDDAVAYAKRHKLPVPDTHAYFSADETLWGRIVRQGSLVESDAPLPSGAWKWTNDVDKTPDTPAELTLQFNDGIALKCTVKEGKKTQTLARDEIIPALNAMGGKHGVGRHDLIVDKVIGLKVRELHECPAADILGAAHRDLEHMTLTSAELEAKVFIDRLWNKCVYDGGWFSRLRRDLDAFVDESQRAVDGTVSVRLFKGSIGITGRKSPRALYDSRLGRRDSRGVLSQSNVRAFARMYGLQDTMAYLLPLD